MPTAKLGLVAASVFAFSVGPAWAQGNPSADSIVNSLRPQAGFTARTRGIRPLAPADSPAPAAERPSPHPAPRSGASAASPRSAPVATADAGPSVNLSVQFANNSAELTPLAIRTLDELGRALSSQALASYRFRIEGHTDTLGDPAHNQELSEQRASAVVDYLVSKFGVDRSRLAAVGMGEKDLLVPTRNNVSEPRNRRVKVVNVGA